VCVDADGVTGTGTVSVVEPTMSVMRSAGRLVVDPRLHAGEIARFTSHVVCGPTASDCNIWTGAIGADGYGRYYLIRQGMGLCVRPHRYALAMAAGALAAGVLGLHECDNMDRMVKMRRGGGRYVVRRGDRRGVRRDDRSPCAKPYGTGGMLRQSKRRCLATNPPCGEFRASD
jgi:hypothetical protein